MADRRLRLCRDRGPRLSRVVRISRRQRSGDHGRGGCGRGTAPARADAPLLVPRARAVGICKSCHDAVGRGPRDRRVCLRTEQCSAIELLCGDDGVCRIHPSQQHRSHACGPGKPRTATMAVSIASRLGHPLLLVLLADGQLRSGEWLAKELKVSRAAVWKAVERLRALGVEVQALPRRGYRLSNPVELLDSRRIGAELGPERRAQLRTLDLMFEVDSTNSRLLGNASPPPGQADACLTELQHAGRGRRGRRWIAPFGAGVALSVAWTFSDGAGALAALSLGVGVAVARALERAGARGVTLKWPNDIWLRDRKLGGVLIELRAEASGPAHVVIGVGVNVDLPAAARREIEAGGVRVAAVADACAAVPSRNLVAGAILDELLSMLGQFEREGFAAFRDAWTALDALSGRPARVLLGRTVILGTSRGVDEEGALLLDTGDRVQRFVSGEASLRVIEGDT